MAASGPGRIASTSNRHRCDAVLCDDGFARRRSRTRQVAGRLTKIDKDDGIAACGWRWQDAQSSRDSPPSTDKSEDSTVTRVRGAVLARGQPGDMAVTHNQLLASGEAYLACGAAITADGEAAVLANRWPAVTCKPCLPAAAAC